MASNEVLELTTDQILPSPTEEHWKGAAKLLGHLSNCHCSTCTMVVNLALFIQEYDSRMAYLHPRRNRRH